MTIAVRSISTVASGASPRTVTAPAGVAAGDLLLLQVSLSANIAPDSVPSGFTLVTGAAITGVTKNIRIYAKTATGSEPASYDVTFASDDASLGILALYSDIGADLIVDGTPSTQTNSSTGDRIWAEVTTTVTNTLLCMFGVLVGITGSTPPGGATEQWDIDSNPRIYLMTEPIAASGATGARTATGSATTSRCVAVAIAEQIVAPADPSDLAANAISASRIDLTWTDNSDDEDGFSLERSPNGTTGWTEIATPVANATSASDTGLSANTTYYYRIKAGNTAGDSTYSAVASALTLIAGTAATGPRLFLLQPEVVLAARVNWATATYPLDLFDVDGVTVGAVADALAGMTICLGATAGGDEYGSQRLRKDGAGARLFVGRCSRGTHDGELTVVDDAYVTVWDDRRVWTKTPYIDSDGAIWKDSDIPVEDHTSEPPPVAVMGQGFAATVDADTEVITVLFNGQNSYATADGATITDYLWDIQDGTLSAGALDDDNITVTFEAGFRYVSLTVTDSNGKTHTTYRPVFADDVEHSLSFDGFTIDSRRITDGGQTLTLGILEDMPRITYPDGTLALVWDREPSGAANRDHMVIVGWLDTEENNVGAGKYGLQRDTTLTIADVAQRLDSLPGFPQSLADDDSRDVDILADTTWNYMVAPTMDKYIHYLLYWHSTALEVADFYWSGTGTAYQVAILSSDGESLWQQVKRQAQKMCPGYELTCTQAGALHVVPDPQLQDEADRTSTVQEAIDEDEWSDLRYSYRRAPAIHWLRTGALLVQSGITYNADGSLYLPTVFSIAPGDTPGQGLGEVDNNEQLAASQLVLNSATGHRYARLNAPTGRLTLTLVQDDSTPTASVPWRAIEPALKEWVTLTVSAATAARRGLTWTAIRALPVEVNMRYLSTRAGLAREIELTLELETSGEPAQTVVKPDVPAVGDDPAVIPDPIPPPSDGLIDGQELVAGIGETSIYRTADFQTDSGSGGPTWEEEALTADTTLTWVVDPFSPGYIAGSGAINGWRATTTKLYRITDIFGTVGESAVVTFANTALWRTVQASFGTYFVEGDNPWLICISYYGDLGGHTGTWATYSVDGGVTWAAEVLVSSFYDSGDASNPIGLYCSPKTPGLAYTVAFTETANPATSGGYVSTDYGATWSEMLSDDPDHPTPIWGRYGQQSPSYELIASVAASALATSSDDDAESTFLMFHPPALAVRLEISGSYALSVVHGASFQHGSARIDHSAVAGISITSSYGSYVQVGDNQTANDTFTMTVTRNLLVDWPDSKEDVLITPPTSQHAPYIRVLAISPDAPIVCSAAASVRVTEIELEDGTIYQPVDGVLVPINGQAGEIHLPWQDNDGEDIFYYGSLDRSGSPVIGLQRAEAGVVTDISNGVYGINHGHFSVRPHDSDRQLVLLAGESGAGDSGVWSSTDAGDTFDEIVTPSATDAPYQAAWSGSLDGILYIWGPSEYITFSSDSGATLDDRSGNLPALSATPLVGLAGGPTP